MTVLRTALALIGLLAASLVFAAPSGAAATPTVARVPANQNCFTSNLVDRCATMNRFEAPDGRSISAQGGIRALDDDVFVKITRVSLQKRTADGWRSLVTNRPDMDWSKGGTAIIIAYRLCGRATPGSYRAFMYATWKEGRGGSVYEGKMISDPVKKSRFC